MGSGNPSKQTPEQRLLSRCGHLVEAYEELGTLQAVGERYGITRERVRQLLHKMRALGLYKYQPMCDRKRCEVVTLVARSLTGACSVREVAHDAGYELSRGYFVELSKQLGLHEAVKARVRENRTEDAVHRLIVRCRTLPHQGHWGEAKAEGYSTTVLQHDAQTHALLARVQRMLGSTKAPAPIAVVRARIKQCLQAGHVTLPHPQE